MKGRFSVWTSVCDCKRYYKLYTWEPLNTNPICFGSPCSYQSYAMCLSGFDLFNDRKYLLWHSPWHSSLSSVTVFAQITDDYFIFANWYLTHQTDNTLRKNYQQKLEFQNSYKDDVCLFAWSSSFVGFIPRTLRRFPSSLVATRPWRMVQSKAKCPKVAKGCFFKLGCLSFKYHLDILTHLD